MAYLLTVTLGAWVFYAVEAAQVGADLSGAPVEGARNLLGPGLAFLAFAGVGLIPAAALTIELIRRSEAASPMTRSVVGAASWVVWGLFVAMTLALASQVVLVPDALAGALVLLAASGAVFAVLAFDGFDTRPTRALTLVALAVTASIILGTILMAGRWGAAA